jgi:DNA-binding transcriptional MerR regulator
VPKGPEAFRTISEAAEELGVPQHVLRFWETKFSFIRPMKRAGGRRFYRPQDLAILRGVRTLLHSEGYTIKGVQKLHKEQGLKRLLGAVDVETPPEAKVGEAMPAAPESMTGSVDRTGRSRLEAVLADLEAAKARLDKLI